MTLIRLKDQVMDTEIFFPPGNIEQVQRYFRCTWMTLHQRFCVDQREPDGPCLCTASFGAAECEMHRYIKSVTEHEEMRDCPLTQNIIVEYVSPDGIKPVTFE